MTLLLGCLGLALLYFGGEWLVAGASALAARIGVSPLAIGLTVVAFGTSAPELVVSVDAVLSGASDVSLGNVVGSNVANLGLILGLAALLRPLRVQAKVLRVDAPLMVGVSLVLVAMLAGGTLSRLDGSLLLLGLLAFTVYTFWESGQEPPPVQEEFASAAPAPGRSAARSGGLALAGLVALVVGGHLLVGAAVELATLLGLSQAIIGLTVVAIGTSLPEFATSVMAALRGQGDIAIGNVLGSNLFNVLGILGLTAVIHPLGMGGLTGIDLGVMVGFAVGLTALLATRSQLGRGEGALLLGSFGLYMAWLLAR